MVICYAGDSVWQIVQALQQLPVPAREPVGWGAGYTDLVAAVSFCSQATGRSHGTVASIGAARGRALRGHTGPRSLVGLVARDPPDKRRRPAA